MRAIRAYFNSCVPCIHNIFRSWMFIHCIAKDLTITPIHKWIRIQLMHCHMTFFTKLIIFGFGCVCCHLLAKEMCVKASWYSIRCNSTDLAFAGTIFTAFTRKRSHLQTTFLHDSLNLPYDRYNRLDFLVLLTSTITIILLVSTDFKYLFLYLLIRIFFIK